MRGYVPVGILSPSGSKRNVSYIYDEDIGLYMFEPGHNMKPFRVKMTHSLITGYGLHKKMEVFRAKPTTKIGMTTYHSDEYISFLEKVTPENISAYSIEEEKYGLGADCPVFDGLYEFCALTSGGSVEAAARLNKGRSDVAINWAGGLHHAKKDSAGGFCYVNDIVLAIIELLRFHKRVLYIDIDIHHGDGVEEAFFTTDRVMTVSFHKHGDFFPGSGDLKDIGVGKGKNYSVNFPLGDGMDDDSYKYIFEGTISKVMEYYRPEAIVLQCGADSLSGDRLGSFNLSMRGHANCINFVKSLNVPTMILGGGGYSMRNVARTWAFETSLLLDESISSTLPHDQYYSYYGPDFSLDVRASNTENTNSPEYLERVLLRVAQNLKEVAFAPSVQMQEVPRCSISANSDDSQQDELDDEEDDQTPDSRNSQRSSDKRIKNALELDDSDDEEPEQVLGKRKRSMDFTYVSRKMGIVVK